jgi:hypothetical protein
MKIARPREGTGEAHLLYGRTTAEAAECLAKRVVAAHVAEREQAAGHLPGYAASLTSSATSFIAEWKEVGKVCPPKGAMGGSAHQTPLARLGGLQS